MMAAFYVAFCLMTIYSAWYMRAIGLDAGVVGLVIGLAYFAGTVLQQWVTQIADRSRRLSLRALGLIQLFFPVAVLLPILCFPLPNYFVAFLFFLCAMCQISLQSLLNAIAMAYNDRGMEVNFGLGRGLGSLGFAVSSFLLGSYFESAPPDFDGIFFGGFSFDDGATTSFTAAHSPTCDGGNAGYRERIVGIYRFFAAVFFRKISGFLFAGKRNDTAVFHTRGD